MTPSRSPGSRQRLKPEQRREQLLATATILTASGGLDRITMAEIAAAAGVSEGLLFYYFPTKRDLTVALVQRSALRLMTALQTVPGGTPRQQLLGALDAYLTHVEQDSVSWQVLLNSSQDSAVQEIHREVEQASFGLLCQALGAETLPPALTLVLDGWLQFEQAVSSKWLEDSLLPREHVITLLAGAFLGAAQAVAAIDPTCAALLRPLLEDSAS
ncbi:TetR/AcrR family transcriptional regulator (plasmid) [Deinococcus taeanensis]|uniref:TetR/AcrR family transcriptional regulator n=1 Tax=Deinococcus taeanensis TaxID=2737050 RepID=UPI001CDBF1B1|nr:TetR/AcrR family transcriptional regulator [Deinococcus taeanensis]UBV45433.1 TetR/AcrR family transcriptional regulator [Deinococcus taeanensis]